MKITKINAIIASIIFSASIITGCKQFFSNSSDIPSYPETIGTNIDVSGINAETNFSTLVSKINEILNIITNPSVMAPADYIQMIQNIANGLNGVAAVGGDFPETLKTDEYSTINNASELKEKEQNQNDSNYETLYKEFEDAFNAYKASYTTYLNSFNNYRDAFAQKSEGEHFNMLKSKLRELILDFNDNYYFEGSYSNMTDLINNTKGEQGLSNEKSAYESAKNGMDNNLKTLKNKYNELESFHLVANNSYTYDSGTIGTLSGNVIYNIPANKDGTDFNMDIEKFYNEYTKIKSMDGVTGVDVVFENLAKTNISGNLDLGNLKSVKELIFGTNEEMQHLQGENLPTFKIRLTDNSQSYKNLYGTDLDVIIATYYNKGRADKYAFDKGFSSTSHYFDAREYLKQPNGSYATMYDNDTYTGKAYNLDINAALVMPVEIKNVNIVGENKTSISKAQTLTNVRIESDMSNVEFSGSTYGYGVVDFVGPAPKVTPMSFEGKVILSSPINQEITVSSAASLDLTKLSSTDIDKLITAAGYKEVFLKDEEARSSFRFRPGEVDVIFVNKIVDYGDPSKAINASNEEWEQAGLTEGIPPANISKI